MKTEGFRFGQMPKWSLGCLFGIVVFVCFLQFPRSIDLRDYLIEANAAWKSSYTQIPYATHQVEQGAYFQTPLLTILLLPWGLLPLWAGKLAWGLFSVLGVLALVRSFPFPTSFGAGVFLLLFFTYPLSDVFLSGNLNFAMLCCLVFGWHGLEKKDLSSQVQGALLVALAICIKPVALLFPAWFVLNRDWKKAGLVFIGLVGWAIFSYLYFCFFHAGSLWSTWWRLWGQALKYYSHAAGPGRDAFQSPPAALYRALGDLTQFDDSTREKIANVFGLALVGLFTLTAWWFKKRDQVGEKLRSDFCLALLLLAIYGSTPFSWACTILFLYPLFSLYASRGRIGWAWGLAIFFALAQKAILPAGLWGIMSHGSAHAYCLLIMEGFCLYRLLPIGKNQQCANPHLYC